MTSMCMVHMPVIQFHGRFYYVFVSEDVYGVVDRSGQRPIYADHEKGTKSNLFMAAREGQAKAVFQFIRENAHFLMRATTDNDLRNISSESPDASDYGETKDSGFTARMQRGAELLSGERPSLYQQDFYYIAVYGKKERTRIVQFQHVAYPVPLAPSSRPATSAAASRQGDARHGKYKDKSTGFRTHMENTEAELASLKMRLLK